MKRRHIQYTVRSVPPQIDQIIRRRAQKEGRSLNDVLIQCLATATGADGEQPAFHDLDWLAGTWHSDPKCDKALADQRMIDAEAWL